MINEIAFCLPLGLEWESKIHRKGHLRLATTLDELEIQEEDDVGINSRYRDIILFSRIITHLGDLHPVTVEMIESLFEADFLYLQLLYNDINLESNSRATVTCPACGSTMAIQFSGLYQDMSNYQQKDIEHGC
jgi:hypothetical protein